MKKLITLCACAAVAVAFAAADGTATGTTTLVVDDDGEQCETLITTIEAAVEEAQPGDVIRVCPGFYRPESVRIDKPLTLTGDPKAIEAIDCFDPRPAVLGDLDPTTQVIIDGSDSTALASLVLAADDIEVAGFVFEGFANPVLPTDDHFFRRALDVSGEYSGYRVHHNLLRLNTVGIMLGSSGARETRFDRNCLRENRWGLAADYRDLINARIDHNATYGTVSFAFETFRLDYARENLSFDHNWSRQDNIPYWISGTKHSRIFANTIESARIGIQIQAANEHLEIARNVITDPFETNRTGFVLQGIGFGDPGIGQSASTYASVRANTIIGMGTPASPVGDGIVAAGPPNAPRPGLMDSTIENNVTTDNLRDGIILRGENARNTVRGNTSDRNGSYGIFVQGAVNNRFEANTTNNNFDGISLQRAVRLGVNYDATGNEFLRNVAEVNSRYGIFADQFTTQNVFELNWMFGNAIHDAHDDARPANTWSGNQCATDFPAGTICGVG